MSLAIWAHATSAPMSRGVWADWIPFARCLRERELLAVPTEEVSQNDAGSGGVGG